MIWRKPQKTDKGAGQDIPDAESLREIPADRRHSGIPGSAGRGEGFIPAVHAGRAGNRSKSPRAET